MTSDSQPPPPQGGGHAAERLREQMARDLGETPDDTQTETPADGEADADAGAPGERADDAELADEPDESPLE